MHERMHAVARRKWSEGFAVACNPPRRSPGVGRRSQHIRWSPKLCATAPVEIVVERLSANDVRIRTRRTSRQTSVMCAGIRSRRDPAPRVGLWDRLAVGGDADSLPALRPLQTTEI